MTWETSSTTGTSSPGAGDDGSSASAAATATRRLRKHTKTRQGCLSCKRRRVKCSQERPACVPCTRNGLSCLYPPTRDSLGLIVTEPRVPQVQSMAELHAEKLDYTALDMRLFHEFIAYAYPHLPVNSQALWTRHVPPMAFESRFLMHSLLALAASSLVKKGDDSLVPAAHFHRVRAMEGVNKLIACDNRSAGEDDALTAACYALSFQVAMIGESPSAFWITIRTITVVNTEIVQRNKTTIFGPFLSPEHHISTMDERLRDFPTLRPELVEEALQAIDGIRPLCQDTLQLQLHNALSTTLHGLRVSSGSAYHAFCQIYSTIAIMPGSDFARFSDPNEHVLQLLHAYIMATQTLMGPFFLREHSNGVPQLRHGDTSTARWADLLQVSLINTPLCRHLRWPIDVQRRANVGSLYVDCFVIPDE